MKKNIKDYDIFDDVPPFDISKHLLCKTTAELSHINTNSKFSNHMANFGNYGPKSVLYNTTTKTVQASPTCNGKWCDVKETEVYCLGSYNQPFYIYDWSIKKAIGKAQQELSAAQKVKSGEFSYLWKENSTQTQIDVQDQDIQVITEVNEQSTQTKNKMVDVAIQTDFQKKEKKEKELGETSEKEAKLTKFVSAFYNKFSDNEEVEEFYNEFLSIMDEHQELNILGDNSNIDFQ